MSPGTLSVSRKVGLSTPSDVGGRVLVVGVLSASIQYPDPHFKKKHAKRRMVQVGSTEAAGGAASPTTGRTQVKAAAG